MEVAIVVSAVLVLYALMLWHISGGFQGQGYRKLSVISVVGGSILFGIAEIWTIYKASRLEEEVIGKITLVVCLTVVYTIITICRVINYRSTWKKIIVILMSAIAITIGILA